MLGLGSLCLPERHDTRSVTEKRNENAGISCKGSISLLKKCDANDKKKCDFNVVPLNNPEKAKFLWSVRFQSSYIEQQ